MVVASLGGLPALSALVAGLPAAFPVPLLVLRHRRASGRQDALAWLLARRTALPVRTGCEGMAIRGPGVTVIPAESAAVIDPASGLRLHFTAARAGP